ncbi:uncharacterized protein LOC128279123 [Anopheles cruzii]|uniref:uncharacterized protein LOC128279123 n=1 Tax=Anopheles cruzii TaxID=68878 RepID=UPI0022EC23AE|nr:uncharacterized protein LOC128279123 [Anopheles cruzii]
MNRVGREPSFGWVVLSLGVLLGLDQEARAMTGQSTPANRLGDSSCEQRTTTTTSQYEEYFDIDKIGNNRTEQHIVDLELLVRVHNMQEELAILLSAANRSRQHPDYGQTYEVRVSNVYTVIYKETLRMSAHHSHTFSFFPGDQFRLRIQITRSGDITVAIPVLQKQTILAVHDDRTPIEVSYISFGSRMNAYPVTIYFSCADGDGALPSGPWPPSDPYAPNQHSDEQQEVPMFWQQGNDAGNDGLPTSEDEEEGHRERGEDRSTAGRGTTSDRGSDSSESLSCPVCPKPEKCEVIVRACTSDTSKDLLMGTGSGATTSTGGEKQKYFFYFNVYLSSKNDKNFKATEAAAVDQQRQPGGGSHQAQGRN